MTFIVSNIWSRLKNTFRERTVPSGLGLDGRRATSLGVRPDSSTRALYLLLAVLGIWMLLIGWFHWVIMITR